MPAPVLVGSGSNWGFQNHHIERLMDHAAMTAAHPDRTLIMAGPPRWTTGGTDATAIMNNLLPLGMVQNFQVGENLNVQPTKAIGSSRTFYLVGTPQGVVNIGRLLANGRNLLRAFMTSARQAGINPTEMDDRAATGSTDTFYCNLNSEMFRIPIGLACYFYNHTRQSIGAFYLELCQIQGWNLGFAAGQVMVMENVNLLFDRLYPISPNLGGTGSALTDLQSVALSGTDPADAFTEIDSK